MLAILRDWGMPAAEEQIDIGDVMAAARKGGLEEMWGVGTAAVVLAGRPNSPIATKRSPSTGAKQAPLAQRLFDELIGLHYGARPDTRGWTVAIE